ncbi:sodium:solute symporter family protein [Ureibacillus aquaedulcis]|uniref:Sodium:solute symporter family protein n=1 Tax=Ureibacillus aquaedulcis TaxID=3058421 RepID=A0ABT8GN35_9BACL|nr:sodium:solute symporter family protein [Ureibacillus sp. BA0131]MDN4492819.1 sodium:solute symporter family protein [Ureibacillus sp. BA0131]
MNTILLITIIGYILLMIVAGTMIGKNKINNTEDYMLAGRSLPNIVLVGTLLATFVGSGTVIGGASFIYQQGPLAGIIYFAGVPIGIVILYFIAGKTWLISKYTIPQILEIKYGKLTRTISSIFIILAYIGIASYQFTGGGYILNLTTGISVQAGTIITAFIVIFLATIGGMFSVAYTDFISSLLILAGFLLGFFYLVTNVVSFDTIIASLPESHFTWTGNLTVPQIIGYFLPLFLLVLADQNMYQRLASAKDANTARRSTIGFFFSSIAVFGLVILLTIGSFALFSDIKPDTAILQLAYNGGLPVIVGALILTASVSFLITTGNSFLLSAAGNITYDIVQRVKPDISDKSLLKINRYSVFALGGIAYILGAFFPDVLSIQMYSYTMYGAALTPAILASFLWKRANGPGALASIVIGGLATLVWELVLQKPYGWNSVLIALPLSIIALIVVSLLTPKYTAQIEEDQYGKDKEEKENVEFKSEYASGVYEGK